MQIDRNNVFEIIEKSGLKPEKDYGQNYLVEPVLAERIANELDVNIADAVLEIGPGLGSLTHFLSLKESVSFSVVDIDKRMTDFLQVIYQSNHINIINNDIRKVDVSSYTKIIGNLPYNITTELVLFLLLKARNVNKMVLMCQSEAFSRFNDTSGENYGPISVLINLLGDTKRIMTVKPGSFVPAPKCNSTVFTFVHNPKCDFDTAIGVYSLCKSLFLSRRKTIQNNLNNLLKDKDKTSNALNKLGVPCTSRPENISPLKYLELFNLLK